MGTDIYTAVQTSDGGRWVTLSREVEKATFGDGEHVHGAFDWRSYGMFGFLADVRNYSCVPGFEPRGDPPDLSRMALAEVAERVRGHITSWLTAMELQLVNYDRVFWDRRITKGNDGAALAEPGEGRMVSLREFLGPRFFEHLDKLAALAPDPRDVRVVFSFD